MRVHTLIVLTLATALIAPTSRAEVEVYFGTVRRIANQDDPVKEGRKAYVVVDRNQKRIGVVTYGRDSLGKRHDFPTITNVDFLEFGRSDAKVEDVFAFAKAIDSFGAPGGGGYNAVFLHGRQVPVVVSVSGLTKNVQPRAGTLTGTIAGAAVTILGTVFTQDTVAVTFHQKRTVEANGGASTVDTTIQHLVGVIEALGYVVK
jgi:hypothetical protein